MCVRAFHLYSIQPLDCLDSLHVQSVWHRSLTGSLNLSAAYGIDIEAEFFYAASEEAMVAVDAALLPGAPLVDAFHIRVCFNQ